MPKLSPAQQAAATDDHEQTEMTMASAPRDIAEIPAHELVEAHREATKRNYGAKRGNKTELFGKLTDDTDFYNWLMFGPQGSGKTTAGCKAANHGRILVIRAEGGLKIQALANQGVNVDNIMVFPAKQGQRVRKEDLVRVHEQLLADLQADPDSWYAVMMDSVTEIHHTLREDATKQRIARAQKVAKSTEAREAIDEDFIDRDDYGKMTGQMREILRDYRDLPCHVIFTALQKVDDQTGENVPAITPALRIDLMGYVDILTAHKGDDDEFRALTRKSGKTVAKDRFGLLPKVWAEPDFDRLLQYMGGEFETGGDDIQDAYEVVLAERAAAKEAAEAEAAAKRTKKTSD